MVLRAEGCNKEHPFPLARTARKVAPNNCLPLKKKKKKKKCVRHAQPSYLACLTFLIKKTKKKGGEKGIGWRQDF